ncbi:ROK family protein [Mucilaginibacter gilvus]|uniref:ROK family protein n=1 Tax=Mucilaginibacter gilvus TaxID=2305909 RepID=A0A3S3Z1X7_9SPHI|nr:ROK family protein [Mucilaginibacter gilvus]RWY51211.1 ROK family protein [Mucilaginibacter gilvus]
MKKRIGELILAIDIGGSHIKATVLNEKGELTMEYEKVETPDQATPAHTIEAVKKLLKNFPAYNKVSVGFPGYLEDGVVITAPNLGTKEWQGYDLKAHLQKELGQPVRVVNDADMQSLGIVRSDGLEMVITLGTGFGTALLLNGILLPHLELGHHTVAKKLNYDQYVGNEALKKLGDKKWNKRMQKVFENLKSLFNYKYLYIGGGNSSKLTMKLDQNMKIVTNEDGIKGGSCLWTTGQVTGFAAASFTKNERK